PHGTIDFALNGFRVRLDLPAAVARAGILDRQFEAGHAPLWHAAALRLRERAGGDRSEVVLRLAVLVDDLEGCAARGEAESKARLAGRVEEGEQGVAGPAERR